ncbi:MAG: hypothetical protein ACI9IV_000780 [Paracoccaceae bacterium]|jgi:hypothetical protein
MVGGIFQPGGAAVSLHKILFAAMHATSGFALTGKPFDLSGNILSGGHGVAATYR